MCLCWKRYILEKKRYIFNFSHLHPTRRFHFIHFIDRITIGFSEVFVNGFTKLGVMKRLLLITKDFYTIQIIHTNLQRSKTPHKGQLQGISVDTCKWKRSLFKFSLNQTYDRLFFYTSIKWFSDKFLDSSMHCNLFRNVWEWRDSWRMFPYLKFYDHWICWLGDTPAGV